METNRKNVTMESNKPFMIRKRFVRYKEVAELYSLGMGKFQRLAKDAGACYKIDKTVLVDCNKFKEYLERYRCSDEEC